MTGPGRPRPPHRPRGRGLPARYGRRLPRPDHRLRLRRGAFRDAPAQVGVIILPLMIFHQLQLFVCAVVAARYRRQMEEEEKDS